MKKLKKINKGLILTIILLIILILYYNNIEKLRKNDKTEIKKACEDFIELTDKYSVLPQEIQTTQTEIPEEKVAEYINQMKKELANIMIDNQEAINIQAKILENNLIDGYNETQVRTQLSRKILNILSYQFEKDQVTVNLIDKVKETIKNSDGMQEYNSDNEFTAGNDEIVVKKVDGKWKVVYANLQFNDNMSYYNGLEREIGY